VKINFRTGIIKIMLILFLIAVLGVAAFLIIDNQFQPSIEIMSEAKIRVMAIKAMNSAILEIINGDTKYTDLVNVVYNKDGTISMIQQNTVKMNELGNRAALLAQDKLAAVGTQGMNIPLGTLVGGELLAGKGPVVHIKMTPVGSVTSEFKTEFESVGINQSRNKIYIVLNAQVRIITPTSSHNVEVQSQMPVSETIVVGNVPNTYINVDETRKMLNLVPIQ
jgi:sporulation protein YunB